MPDLPINGDGRALQLRSANTGPHESAALLLVESLIHGLIDQSVLSVEEAIKIIEIAAEVECDRSPVANDDALAAVQPSLLMPIADSLRFERKE